MTEVDFIVQRLRITNSQVSDSTGRQLPAAKTGGDFFFSFCIEMKEDRNSEPCVNQYHFLV